ncbi:MAG: type VI secretion system tip protein TssI/VgrG [Pseudomonadota bacterium]
MKLQQADRSAIVATPTGPDSMVLSRMTVRDRLNGLFSIDLRLVSTDFDIAPDDVLGEPFGVSMRTSVGERCFHGIVTEFRFAGSQGRLSAYEATLRPWVWLLGYRSDCRIFQEMSAPDIITAVVDEAGFGGELDVSGLTETYEAREYCVQYNETDLDFILRLMEDEGINYVFRFEEGRHVMALSDWNDAFEPAPDYEQIAYFPQDGQQRREKEHIYRWSLTRALVSGAAALTDYDFSAPKKDLLAASAEPLGCSHGDKEMFEWPGGYFEPSPGDRRVRVRRESLQTPKEIAVGVANARGLDAGRSFTLENFPREDQNKDYVVIEATHDFTAANPETGGEAERYECRFRAVGKETPIRPGRTAPRPRVYGPQVAIVVGPSGEEIFTDEHGRIKVHFYWDRHGEKDENASCWVRVAQPWAGKGWGFQHIPRLGQEVIVEFLEGDPDRPVVVGALYNGDNAPPFALPGSKTQSGVRSNSSTGGGGSNELRFEDAAGSEQIYIHAQKDQDVEVENNETHQIGVDRTKSIGNDETVSVGNNRTESVGVDQSTTIGSNETHSVGVDQSMTVGANQTVGVGANRSWTIGANETISVGAVRSHTVAAADNLAVGGAQAVEVGGVRGVVVGGAQSHTVGASDSTTVGGSQDVTVGGSQDTSVGGGRSASVGKSDAISVADDFSLTAGKTISISAADEITIATGDAVISMKKDGTIVIKGKDVSIDASGKIALKSSKDTSVKASGDVVLKGKKVLGN